MQVNVDERITQVLDNLPSSWSEPQRWYTGILRPHAFAPNPSCPRAYLYANRLGWRTKRYSSEALSIGSIVHIFFANLFSSIENGFEGALDVTASDFAQALDVAPSDKRESMMKSWNISRVMVDQWWHTYNDKQNSAWLRELTDQEAEVLSVEQQIIEPIRVGYIGTVNAVGSLDLVIRNPKGVWIFDHKTTAQSAPDRAQGLGFDLQARLYRELWDAANPDKPSFGMAHNIISKPTIRLKRSETYDDYFQRVSDWYEEHQLGDPRQVPMVISWVRFNEAPLDQNPELQVVVASAASWCRRPPSLDTFPRVRSQCTNFGRTCPYMDLCNSDCKLWPSILERGDFRKADEPIEEARSPQTIQDLYADSEDSD